MPERRNMHHVCTRIYVCMSFFISYLNGLHELVLLDLQTAKGIARV